MTSVPVTRLGKWLQGDTGEPGVAGFSLSAVLLHEMGHTMGLVHSERPEDVMSPYYFAGQISLSENDKARAAASVASE